METPSQVSELAKYQTQHSSQIKTKSKLLTQCGSPKAEHMQVETKNC